jgi:hypothetical protein
VEFTGAATKKKQFGVAMNAKASGRVENADRSVIDCDEAEKALTVSRKSPPP